MARGRINISPAMFRRRLEAEFAATMHPPASRISIIARETGRKVVYIKHWFMRRRREARTPAPGAVPDSPDIQVVDVAVFSVHGLPDWQYGMPLDRKVAVKMGNTFSVERVSGSMKREATGWIFIPEKATVTLPKPEFCYSGTLAAEIENQENEEISKEDEATFRKLLRIKLKCGICVSGVITVRCPSCFSGLCGDCVIGLVKHSQAPLNCPYCRCEDQRSPFEPVSMPRI